MIRGYLQPGTGGAILNTSGAVTSGALGDSTVYSGNIASGQVGPTHLGSGSVLSGHIASGQVGQNHLASGSLVSGRFASGVVDTYQFASGAVVRAAQFVSPIQSGTAWTLITEEAVSGIRCVAISQSGNVRVAMAAVSGRMPAVGVVVDNVLSGIQVNIWECGVVTPTSGLFTAIGHFGEPVWVGRSGHMVPISGSFGSGGYASGDIGQKVGVGLAIGSGGILLNVNETVWSGGPLGEATGGGIV